LAYLDGRSVVQMKYGTSHFDLPVYPEAMIYPGSPTTTMGTFQGNPVLTKSDAGVASPGPLATMVVHDTRDIQVGQTLNLFNSDRSGWEKVTVHAVARNTNTVTFDNVAFSHGAHSILRGTQAYDGCQMVGSPVVPEPDGAAPGGIADYLITGTCGEDGTSMHRAAGVYCREFTGMTVFAGPTMNGAACVNMTNKSVTFNSLLVGTAGGTCPGGIGISYCLTRAYTHVCGAFDSSDDGCLAETPPISTQVQGGPINGSPIAQTFQVGNITNIHAQATYLLGPMTVNQELITILSVIQPNSLKAIVLNHHDNGSTLRSPTATIQVDNSGDGGGGTLCGAGFPNFTFSTMTCPSINMTQTVDTIPPMSGVLLLP